jgi:DNA-binding NtrC family response regulator
MISVLIVDDDPECIEILRNLYRYQSVITCSNAKDALDHLNNKTFEVLQLDYDLHDDLTGEEVARFLSKHSEKPIVVVHSDNANGAALIKSVLPDSIHLPISKIMAESSARSRLKQYLSYPLGEDSLPGLLKIFKEI